MIFASGCPILTTVNSSSYGWHYQQGIVCISMFQKSASSKCVIWHQLTCRGWTDVHVHTDRQTYLQTVTWLPNFVATLGYLFFLPTVPHCMYFVQELHYKWEDLQWEHDPYSFFCLTYTCYETVKTYHFFFKLVNKSSFIDRHKKLVRMKINDYYKT